jgi:hypothetical protein
MENLKHWKREYSIYKKNKDGHLNDIFYHSIEGFEAFQNSSKILMEALYYKGIDPNMVCTKDSTGDTLLHRAAATGNVEGVAILLNEKGINRKIKNKAGLKAQDVICTRINPHGSLGQLIQNKKFSHSTYSMKPEETSIFILPEYLSCQDPNFDTFTQIRDMFAEFKHFRKLQEAEKGEEDSKVAKKPRTSTP